MGTQKLKLFSLIWGDRGVLGGACLPGWLSPRASVSHCALIVPGHLSGQLGRQTPNTCLQATPWQLPHAVPPHSGKPGRAVKLISEGEGPGRESRQAPAWV